MHYRDLYSRPGPPAHTTQDQPTGLVLALFCLGGPRNLDQVKPKINLIPAVSPPSHLCSLALSLTAPSAPSTHVHFFLPSFPTRSTFFLFPHLPSPHFHFYSLLDTIASLSNNLGHALHHKFYSPSRRLRLIAALCTAQRVTALAIHAAASLPRLEDSNLIHASIVTTVDAQGSCIYRPTQSLRHTA